MGNQSYNKSAATVVFLKLMRQTPNFHCSAMDQIKWIRNSNFCSLIGSKYWYLRYSSLKHAISVLITFELRSRVRAPRNWHFYYHTSYVSVAFLACASKPMIWYYWSAMIWLNIKNRCCNYIWLNAKKKYR